MANIISRGNKAAKNPFHKIDACILAHQHPLIPVAPPDARPDPGLSPAKSAAFLKARGKVPAFVARRDGNGEYWQPMPNWREGGAFSATSLATAQGYASANFGIVLGLHPALPVNHRLVGIDMDTTLPGFREAIAAEAVSLCGGKNAFLRHGHPDKAGMVFVVVELPEGMDRLRKIVVDFGSGQKVEVLAEGQQSVIAGGHPEGVPYRWENHGHSLPASAVTDLPVLPLAQLHGLLDRLKEIGAKHGRSATTSSAAGSGSSRSEAEFPELDRRQAEMLQEALGRAANAFDRGTWVQIIKTYRACCKAALGLEQVREDLLAFDERYEGDSDGGEALDAVLAETSLPDGFGLMQLIDRLRDAMPPEGRQEAQEALVRLRQSLARQDFDAILSDPEAMERAKAQAKAAAAAAMPQWVRMMNSKYAFASGAGASAAKCIIVFDGGGGWALEERAKLELLHKNDLVEIGRGKNNLPILKPRFAAWMAHPQRRTFPNGLRFMPGQPREVGGAFNTWNGWGVQAVAGPWPVIEAHIRDVLCGGDVAMFQYVLGWIAYRIQNPTGPVSTVLVFRSSQGVGKSVFGSWLLDIFGSAATIASAPDHVVGKFNTHLRDCNLLLCEEAVFSGDPKVRSQLKTLIADPKFRIEGKGLPSELVDNHLGMIWFTNERWAAPVEVQDRRFVVIDCGKKRDRAYYDRLIADAPAELPAFLHALLHRDISKFTVQDYPKTAARDEQITAGLQGLDRFIHDTLERGRFPKGCGNDFDAGGDVFKDWDTGRIRVPKDIFRSAVNDYMVKHGHGRRVSDLEINDRMKNLGGTTVRPKVKGKTSARSWDMPKLDVVKRAFAEVLGLSDPAAEAEADEDSGGQD